MQITLRAQPIHERLKEAQRRRDWNGVVRCMDELMALDGPRYANLAGGKFQTQLLNLEQHDQAYAFARAAVTGVTKDDASALGQIAYVIVFMSGDVVEDELAVARAAALRANELAKGERAGILDTLARVHFLADELEQALATQKLAITRARSDGERWELERRMSGGSRRPRPFGVVSGAPEQVDRQGRTGEYAKRRAHAGVTHGDRGARRGGILRGMATSARSLALLVLGDEVFFRIVTDWMETNRNGNGSTAAFVAHASRCAGRELAPFFDAWLFADETPEVK